ncbi:MAG: CRISPR-associated endonuclease Cas2 [Longimicrobiales bacterium]
MDRRHYIVSYDISDDRRRDQVFRTLLGQGDHAQYSVFFCELNDRELVNLRARLRACIHATEDQVLIVDLGPAIRPLQAGLEAIGRAYDPPVRTFVV